MAKATTGLDICRKCKKAWDADIEICNKRNPKYGRGGLCGLEKGHDGPHHVSTGYGTHAGIWSDEK